MTVYSGDRDWTFHIPEITKISYDEKPPGTYMTSEAIRIVMHKNVPFRLKTADGSVYNVPHPDFISVSNRDTGFVSITTDESFVLLDLMSITAIELDRPAGATASS